MPIRQKHLWFFAKLKRVLKALFKYEKRVDKPFSQINYKRYNCYNIPFYCVELLNRLIIYQNNISYHFDNKPIKHINHINSNPHYHFDNTQSYIIALNLFKRSFLVLLRLKFLYYSCNKDNLLKLFQQLFLICSYLLLN